MRYTRAGESQESLRGISRISSGESYYSVALIYCIKIGCTLAHKPGDKIQRLIENSHVNALARGFYTLGLLVKLYFSTVEITIALAIVGAFSLFIYRTLAGHTL